MNHIFASSPQSGFSFCMLNRFKTISTAAFLHFRSIPVTFRSSYIKMIGILLGMMTIILPLKAQTTITTAGTGSYTVPAGVTSLQVEVWGGGGRGGTFTYNGAGGGGGGGAYSYSILAVTPGQAISYTVGAGSSSTAAGGDTWFVDSSTLMAKGGSSVANNNLNGANGGATASGIGQMKYSGGNGADGTTGGSRYGGGGGSSAGTAEDGVAGNTYTGGTAPAGGGNGGNGATSNGNGNNGLPPGGGGGGARSNNNNTYTGGSGANGQIIITPRITPFWLKADAGTSTTTNGTGVTTWNDQSGYANHATSPAAAGTGFTASTAAPPYQSMLWNFNPGINFSNGYFRLNRGGIQNDMTFFTVYNSTQTATNTSWWLSPAIIGAEASGSNNDFGLGHNNGILFFKGINPDPISGFVQTTTNYNTGAPRIVTATRKKGTTPATNYLYVNGTQAGSKASDNNTLSDPAYIGIGRNPTTETSQFVGGISEAIGKNYLVNTSERYTVETYLAVKYGITLPYDYKRAHASDSIIYPVLNYEYDIAGLGRNDTYGLHQKVSSSVNVATGSSRIVMATINDFTTSNLSTSRTALTNGQYLIWGHNNTPTTSWNAISGSKYQKVTRVWQIRNTGNVGTVQFQIDLSSYPALPASHFYAVLVASDATFTGATTFYRLTKSTGNLYTAQPAFDAGTGYFTIAAIPNYWVGTPQSTVWSAPANWSAGVPAPGDDVEFATTTNYGSAAVNNLEVDGHYVVGKLTNASNYNLVIPASKSLTVNGAITITDATNPLKIQVKASSDGTTPNGTLIINCAANSTGGVPKSIYGTVQLYAKGDNLTSTNWTDNISDSPTNGTTFTASYKWQHFGVPVKEIKANPTFYGTYLRKYNEKKNFTDSFYGKWETLNNESLLKAFEGYEITQDAAKMIEIAGELQFCDKTLTLTREAAEVAGNTTNGNVPIRYGLGQNIFGNSYTAAVKISQMTLPATVEQTVYLYNTGSFAQWGNATLYPSPANTATMVAGSYISIPRNTSNVVWDDQIPSMQGFLLKYTATETVYSTTNNAQVTLKYDFNGVTVNTRPQLAPRAAEEPLSYLRVNLQSASTVDNLWLFSREGTSNRFDNGWDGRKYFGTPTAFIYSMTPDGPMQVNTDKTIDGSVISFYSNADKDYTLTLVKSNLGQYSDLKLIDLTAKTVTPLTEEVTTYRFAATTSLSTEKRFIIANNTLPVDFKNSHSGLLTGYINADKVLTVTNFTGETGTMTLTTSSGIRIMSESLPSGTSHFPTTLRAGAYILSMEAGDKRSSFKILVFNK